MTEQTAEVQAPAFNWDEVTGATTQRLRKPKIPACPAGIVAQAQRSYDGVKNAEDGLDHILTYTFPSEAVASEFAKLMKNAAGFHTTPMTSVTVVVDPEDTGDTKTVSWKAGARRGAAAK